MAPSSRSQAYAAALSHHAYILIFTRATWATLTSVVLFLLTATPTVCQWWAISIFLCRYDPGDLFNEWVLVVYMVLVVGQSLTVQDCANCLLSRNHDDVSCIFQTEDESGLCQHGPRRHALGRRRKECGEHAAARTVP